jgi:2-iminoacetate synthase
MRDTLFDLGVSQISAESKTSPGGYKASADDGEEATQFILSDRRSLDEVIRSLIEKGYIPSFCAACYRKGRTGEAFMDLARPGTIKGKCAFNALLTLKEYLDDFGSVRTKKDGYALIKKNAGLLDQKSKGCLKRFFDNIDKGRRDEYV